MHTIYIDILIFINMFQDFIMLLLVKKLLHIKTKFYRIIIASAFGGISSLVALLPTLNFIFNIIINIFIASILILVAFGFGNLKSFIKHTSSLFVISFLTNGAMIFFYLAIKPKGMYILNDTVYFNISPLLLIIITGITYFILFLYKKLFNNHSKHYLIKKVTVIYKDREYIIPCKVDSGCNLQEPFSGNYVIIIEKSELPDIKIDEKKMRIIPFSTVAGNGLLKGFKADVVKIDAEIIKQDIYIGMCNNIFKNNIKGLIPENLIKD